MRKNRRKSRTAHGVARVTSGYDEPVPEETSATEPEPKETPLEKGEGESEGGDTPENEGDGSERTPSDHEQ